MLIYPNIFKPFQSVIAGQSTRHGGVSKYPYHSLNFGYNVGDSIASVNQNYTFLHNMLNSTLISNTFSNTFSFIHGNQIHSDTVAIVADTNIVPTADALITAAPNLFVSILTADCTPILLLDTRQNIVAAIHAGWRGTHKQIVVNTLLTLFNSFGTKPQHIYAYIGACISATSYEVGEDVYTYFSEKFLLPISPNTSNSNGKRFLNLKAANYAQLVELNIPSSHIEVSPHCTYQQHGDFFSHRHANGKTGRMISFIGFTKGGFY